MNASPDIALKPISYKWIINRNQDMVWFILSAASGYLLIYMFAGLNWDITTIWFFWVMLIDTPHFFGTYSRTYFDKVEFQNRKRLLIGSFGWFFLGPSIVLICYGLYELNVSVYQTPWFLFVVFFSLWAYWHVVRQHYGFLMLYKRKNNETSRLDYYIDSTMLYGGLLLPFFAFAVSELDAKSIIESALSGVSLDAFSSGVSNGVIIVISIIALVYAIRQLMIYAQSRFFNLPKNLFILAVVPLHIFICFSEWSLAAGLLGFGAFVTVFHDFQYHAIVWFHHKNRYKSDPDARAKFGLSSVIGSSLKKYIFSALLMGVVFRLIGCSFEIHPGCVPLVRTSTIPLFGEMNTNQLLLGFLLGIAMHHYYIDQFIWRTSKDKQLVKDLKLEQ